ncbi:E3 ubiquitin-protein ligase WAV3-like [Wolffia australiana]
MAEAWRRAKIALGQRLNLCLSIRRTRDEAQPSSSSSDLTGLGPWRALSPASSSSSDVRLSKPGSGRSSSKRTCAICLGAMKTGVGRALFTAECSHVFHFQCIASSVKYGNQACPVCRAKWKDLPFPAPEPPPHGRARISPLDPPPWPAEPGRMTVWRPLPRAASAGRRRRPHAETGAALDDDEPLARSSSPPRSRSGSLEVTACPEFPAVARGADAASLTVLVHLKAPPADASHEARAAADLVAVLDVSGSMAGTKLALLKRAMGFVIQHLGPSDRLSVVAFSSAARRLFPLRRMSAAGSEHALRAVHGLAAGGGTNIAEALKLGLRVLESRRQRNPVCGVILLSDGQDTHALSGAGQEYGALLPRTAAGPVHAFGLGADHDAALMHAVAERSGGTFSFIEAEGAIQAALAQCVGGLLSVVVQEARVRLECVHPRARIVSVRSGGYAARVEDGGRRGSIAVGDLYADEERDFLVGVAVPALGPAEREEETAVLAVGCGCRRAGAGAGEEEVGGDVVRVRRPAAVAAGLAGAVEVGRQRNRERAAEAMAEARAAAEGGALAEAVAALERGRRAVGDSAAARAGDGLSAALVAELGEMQDRMASRQRYEVSGRAYVLSGLSSHSWQRATARGDSTTVSVDGAAALRDLYYQTPSMVNMLHRSQTFTPPR